jgi:uncharacterized membrane protein YedE/YeeE
MYNLDDLEPSQIANICAVVIGLVYGAVAQKTQFCFSGSIKDFVLRKSTRRSASILTAMISAILFSQLLSYGYAIDFTTTIYLKPDINYVAIVVGGVLFGIGMMKADGCSSRHLVKFSQGDLHSLVTLLTIAVFAYMTAKGLFSHVIGLLQTNETLLALSSQVPNRPVSTVLIISLLVLALWRVVPNAKNLLRCSDGFVVGLLIGLSWFVTGVLGFDAFKAMPLESLSFVYPSGKTLEYLMFFSGSTLSFSISVVFGIIAGGFVMSLFNKKYTFSCAAPQNSDKLKNSIIGGSFMGTGGILAMGCTIGQGLTGISTLAVSSFIAIISIALSAYITALYMAKKEALPSCFDFDWSI